MNKLLKETGVLTDHGQEVVHDFKATLKNLLEKEEVNALNVSETRTLGSVLNAILGNAITNQIMEVDKLTCLTKESLPEYLVTKYGKNWGFSSLTKEEYAFWFKLNPHNLEKM
jgi:hypothetical protein